MASRVVPAHVSDAAAALACWDEVATTHPLPAEVQVVLGDHSFARRFANHLARYYGIWSEKPLHIVRKKNGFCIHS